MYKPYSYNNYKVALYKGDKLLHQGIVKELAELLNIQPETIMYYRNPRYLKLAKGNRPSGRRRLVILSRGK